MWCETYREQKVCYCLQSALYIQTPLLHVSHINPNTNVMFVAECWERCGCLWRNTSLSVAAASDKVCVSVVNARLLQVMLVFPTISEMLCCWMSYSCWHFLFVPYVAIDVVLSDVLTVYSLSRTFNLVWLTSR